MRGTPPGGLDELVDKYRRELITRALKDCGGNVNEAAKILKVHRNTVSRWVYLLDLPRNAVIMNRDKNGWYTGRLMASCNERVSDPKRGVRWQGYCGLAMGHAGAHVLVTECSTPKRCSSIGPEGLQCGLPTGHGGLHNNSSKIMQGW